MRRVRVVLLSLLTMASAAPSPAQDEAAYDKGYAAVRALMQQGKWPEARKALLQLLESNQGKLYAVADRQAIVEDHQQCSFWCETKVPRPQEVIAGKVEVLDPSSGHIRVRYSDADMSDFEEVRVDLYMHPVVFKASYSVTVSGDSYPETGVTLWFDFDGRTHYRASFGDARQKPSVRQFEGDKGLGAETTGTGAARVGKPFVLQLKVGGGNVELWLDKKALLKTKRGDVEGGQVAIAGRCGDIVIEGDMEPSWFQGCVDEFLAGKREDYADEYRAEQELPEWLFADFKVERVPARHEFIASEHHRSERGEEFFDLLEENENQKALDLIGKLGDADIAASDRTYLTALVQQRLGEAEAALPLATQALDAAPDLTWLRVLKAEVLSDLGRPAEGLPLLQQAHRDDPGNQKALQALFVALLRAGDVAGGEHLVREAKCKYGLWEDAFDLDRMLSMRRRGPAWPRHFQQSSAHYDVHSDIDAKICAYACRVLEESYDNLTKQFAKVVEDKDAPRFQVFLFSGESGYQEYNDGILGHAVPHSAGLYSSVLKQLLIWNVPKREDMVKTIRHEGFHQFLDRVMQDPPVWFNEGMAEFWETAQKEGGRFTGGQMQPQHLATLQKDKQALLKLKDLVYGGRGDFYAHAQQRYAQGWSLVHFLLRGPAANQRIFKTLWAALSSGDCSRKAALDKAFAGVDWDKFEAEYRSYVDKLAKQK